VLEVIEKDELVEVDNIVLFFEMARAEGCLIAVDDFGSGFSNYANLLALPIDIIKIDGGLVKNMPHDENALVMVESIAGLCRRMNKLTVAEFVENGHILDHIRNMGVDMAQGYHLGHPEPLETFLGEFPD
jgi:EAL domain-containing protein (putative c-di-GMP-specific phosphodiesterase class I)